MIEFETATRIAEAKKVELNKFLEKDGIFGPRFTEGTNMFTNLTLICMDYTNEGEDLILARDKYDKLGLYLGYWNSGIY